MISFSIQVTPPYSLLKGNQNEELTTVSERYKWIEFHKWKFDAQWFTPLTTNKKLVVMTRANFGFVGFYNPNKGLSPFERFRYGGTGLTGVTYQAQFLGAEIVGMRGYPDGTISRNQTNGDAPIYNRFTMELRYPISLNPSATVFALGFLEGGNAWSSFRDFDPFNIKRSAGVGVRVFLPMFGLLGLDYGYPFDNIPGVERKGQIHFIIGQNFN
jgi:outer membrane protein insertion porin family